MSILLEFFGVILVDYLIVLPGAFIRWAYLNSIGKKVAFKECITRKAGFSGLISLSILVFIAILV